MAQKLLVTALLIMLLVQAIHGANILFLFGGANYSHKMSIWPLVMALTQKGHNVTFISSVPEQPKPNPKVRDLVPGFMKKLTEDVYQVDRIQDRKNGREVIWFDYEDDSLKLCDLTLNSQDDLEFTYLLENGVFDLVVVNHVYGDCAFFLAHHFGCKFVTFDSSTVYRYGIFGLQMETSWIADYLIQAEYPMNFWSRLHTWFNSFCYYTTSAGFDENLRQIYMKRFGLTHAPSLIEIQRNASLGLVNSHYTTDFARPLPPLYVEVGGMQSWELPGVLPKNFKNFMDSFEDGVILISFGSTIEFNTLPEAYISIFFTMMKKFETVGFILRWNGPLPENHPKNLMASKWLPQREILREKSVRALMSHGGMNSMQEATYNGVPIISMPLFADQDFQAYRVQAQEIGVRVEAATLSQEKLDEAILKILTNPQYKKNMMARSKLFRDRPNPTDTAVEAIEFVLRHDDLSALKPMDLHQSFWVRQHVDIYFFCFAVLTALNLMIPFTILLICKKFVVNS